MPTVIYYTADGKKVGEEAFGTLAKARKAAREFVTRNGQNTYKRQALRADGVKYYHSYGEREAIVREDA